MGIILINTILGYSGGGRDLANRVQINRLLRDWLLGIPLGQRIHGMGTKIGSKYGKTPGKVKNYPPIMGAAEGRPHKGCVFLYFSCLFFHIWTLFWYPLWESP